MNVALPSIRRDLHASLSGLQWTVDAYTIVLASLLMLAGSTGDRLGRKRVFQIGLLPVRRRLAAVQPRADARLADRVPRASRRVGGSMLNPVAMSIITQRRSPTRASARRAIGVWGGDVRASAWRSARSSAALLIEAVGWRAIFWINVPIGARGDRAHRAVRAGVARARGRAASTRSASCS